MYIVAEGRFLVKPTMQDVADIAQVSRATVSRVLSERAQVSRDKREVVLEAVRKLGYEPHKKTYTNFELAVCVTPEQQKDPFYMPIIKGVQIGIRGKGRVKLYTNSLPSLSGIDGVIIFGDIEVPSFFLDDLRQSQLPVVVVNGAQDIAGFSYVCIEERKAMIQVIQELVTLKHDKIAFIGGPLEDIGSQERLRSYKLGLLCSQLSVDNHLIVNTSDTSQAAGYIGAKNLLLLSSPTAIIAANDQMALGIYEAAAELQKQIPEDISVVGFADIEAAVQVNPRLSTVGIPLESMGKWGVSLLVSQINDPELSPARVSVPAEFVIRESIK